MPTTEDAAAAAFHKAIAEYTAGHLKDAEALFIEAAALASSAAGDAMRLIQGRAFGNIGNINAKRGLHREALTFNEKALLCFRDLRDEDRQSLILFNMAGCADALGDDVNAEKWMTEAASISRDPQRAEDARRWLFNRARAAAAATAGSPELDAPGLKGAGGKPAPAPISRAKSGNNVVGAAFTPDSELDALLGFARQSPDDAQTPQQQSNAALASNNAGRPGAAAAAAAADASRPRNPVPSARSSGAPSSSTSLARQFPASSASSSQQQQQQQPPSMPSATPMLEFGYDNLRYGDVVSRAERELALLDAVEGTFRIKAAASDAYARNMADAAGALAGQLLGTGLGIAHSIHFGAARAGAGPSAIAAVRSALTFLVGNPVSSGSNTSASASAAASGGGGGSAFPDVWSSAGAGEKLTEEGSSDPSSAPFSVSTGGFDTQFAAIASSRRSLLREAMAHHRLAGENSSTSSRSSSSSASSS